MLNIVHVTHEAVVKVGGIGTVLEGLLTSAEYDRPSRSVAPVMPLFNNEGDVSTRLGPGGEVTYSSIDGMYDGPHAHAFNEIRQRYHVDIVYGRRHLRDPITGGESWPEVALIDICHMEQGAINHLKHQLFNAFGIESTRFENSWDYEQYVRLAIPGLAVAKALGLASGEQQCAVIGHEFMGVPTALAAKLDGDTKFITAYHAHEVSTARKIVEEHEGHDTAFYNILRRAPEEGRFIGEIFGDQTGYYRHALIESTRFLDVTLAVSDYVVDELRNLTPNMRDSNIQLCYNGVPAYETTTEEAAASKRRLQTYAENLIGDRPHYIFTHVTRMTPSKGLWRDMEVMKHIEQAFRKTGESAVLFVLSTELPGPRSKADVLHMEKWWDWPVAHREQMPDLTGGEAVFYQAVQSFNARSRHCKIIFINQFGFARNLCGSRMPADMCFADIRRGSDVEFGQSIYEPFGIAQVEALSFGAICVMSGACGCSCFVDRVAGPDGTKNVIAVRYARYRCEPDTIESYLHMTRETRENYEREVAEHAAAEIVSRLPRTPRDKEAYLARGFKLASQMSWDVISRDYFLPAIKAVAPAEAMAV